MLIIRILQILFAIAMLLLGRKLFWVFVGSIGFILTTEIAVTNLAAQPEWIVVLIGLAAGLVGALLAVFFQAGAIAIAGLLSGGYLGIAISRSLQINGQTALTILYIVGALVGLILFLLLFDGALIAISSILGSFILVQHIGLSGSLFWVVFVILAFIGIWIQISQLNQAKKEGTAAG